MLLSPAQEEQIDKKYAPIIEKQLGGRIIQGENGNDRLQNYIDSVGRKIVSASHMPQKKFTFTAVNDKSVNAMALPGGQIFITRGMLEVLESEAQLAAVLAHETAHITARHVSSAMSNRIGMDLLLSLTVSEKNPEGAVQLANLGSQMLSLSFSRSDEREADTGGLDYLARAGYPPQAMVELMETLDRQHKRKPIEFFSTHPNPENRKGYIQSKIYRRGYRTDQNPKTEEYKKNVLQNL